MTFIGDANDTATILAAADIFFSSYFADSDADEVNGINADFNGVDFPPYWPLGQLTCGLIQVYDLVLPLDPDRSETYLTRLGAAAETQFGS